MKKSVFVLLLVCGLLLSVPAQGAVTITPSNFQLDSVGHTVSFDFLIMDPDGVSSQGFQSTITYSGPGTLTLDEIGSKAVTGDVGYWLPSSPLVNVFESLPEFVFGDGPDDAIARALAVDDIMARYVFEYDTPGDYIITLDLDPSASLIQDEFFGTHAFLFDPGSDPDFLPGSSNSFTITPEPVTLMLLGLGGTILLRKRRA